MNNQNKIITFINKHIKFSLLILPLLIVLFRGWNGFAYPSASSPYSDLTLSHYMLIDYIRQQLFNHHVFPLWFPTILSGTPLYANPLAGLWYPFGWPSLFLPLPFGFNVLVGLHLSWGSLGMYLLLRKQGLRIMPSLYGGVVFGLMPKLIAHYGAGHLTLMYAIPWTPWLLLTTPPGKYSKYILPAIILALIFFADVRWAAYSGLLWLFWILVEPYSRNGSSKVTTKLLRQSLFELLRKLGYVMGLIALIFLLVAVLAVPLIEYTNLSTRVNMQTEDIFNYSLNLPGLLGLFYPPFRGGVHETTLYLGGIVLLLGSISLLQIKRNRLVLFWFGVFLVSIFISFAGTLTFLTPISSIPILSLLRVPTRGLFIGGMAMSTLAAITLDGIDKIKASETKGRYILLIFIITISVFLLGILLALIAPIDFRLSFLWGAFALLAACALLWVYLLDKINNSAFVIGLFFILIVDIGLAGQSMIDFRSKQSVFADNSRVVAFLSADQSRFRVFSPGFGLLQHEASHNGLEVAEGVDPLHLSSYAKYLSTASGIPSQGYSVTVPDFLTTDELRGSFRPDPTALGWLNIKYILVDYDLIPIDGLVQIEQIRDTRIYENLKVKPRAWIYQPGHDEADSFRQVEDFNWSPNQIDITAEGPGRLVLSEIDYPGWHASMDGNDVAILTEAGILRSVDLPAGGHNVSFVLIPLSLYLGIMISSITWILLFVYMIYRRSRP